jgi:hypothetical protein
MQLTTSGATRGANGFISPEQWFCTITKPQSKFILALTPKGRPSAVSLEFAIPKKPESAPLSPPNGAAKTVITETQSQKAVTEQDGKT